MKKRIMLLVVLGLLVVGSIITIPIAVTQQDGKEDFEYLEASLNHFLNGDLIWITSLKTSCDPPYVDVHYANDYLRFSLYYQPLVEDSPDSCLITQSAGKSKEDLPYFLPTRNTSEAAAKKAESLAKLCNKLKTNSCFLLDNPEVLVVKLRIYRNSQIDCLDATGKWHTDLSIMDFKS